MFSVRFIGTVTTIHSFNQFIQVGIHLVFQLKQGETPICTCRLQPCLHWSACCRPTTEERGPWSRSYPPQGPVNDVAYHWTCEDQLRYYKTAELTHDAIRHLVQSLILSRVDYCNVAFAGVV